jgi:redox-sensing transcriptional repressor
VRKDLSYLGSYGTRGVGYDVQYLVYQISRELGSRRTGRRHRRRRNLGHALANYGGFAQRGFSIAALSTSTRGRWGEVVAGQAVRHLDDCPTSYARAACPSA